MRRRCAGWGLAVTNDPITAEMTAAIQLLRGGDRACGRRALEAVWAQIAHDPDPFQECVLAHHMADAQDDLAEELAWDVRSLDAALRCTDADAARHQAGLTMGLFLPSVYVNLAEDYFKLGDMARSREHLDLARGVVGNLADDAYGQLIRGGVARMAKRLEAAGA